MTFTEILETLKYSVDYIEFMINYNELLPDIVKEKNNSLNEWRVFIKDKNEIRKRLYDDHCQLYPIEIIRQLREAKYIYEFDITKYLSELEKITNFKNRLIQLQ